MHSISSCLFIWIPTILSQSCAYVWAPPPVAPILFIFVCRLLSLSKSRAFSAKTYVYEWLIRVISILNCRKKELCIELCLSESSTLSKYTIFINVPPTSSPKIFPIQSPLLLSSPEDSDSWLYSEVLLFKSMLASNRSDKKLELSMVWKTESLLE